MPLGLFGSVKVARAGNIQSVKEISVYLPLLKKIYLSLLNVNYLLNLCIKLLLVLSIADSCYRTKCYEVAVKDRSGTNVSYQVRTEIFFRSTPFNASPSFNYQDSVLAQHCPPMQCSLGEGKRTVPLVANHVNLVIFHLKYKGDTVVFNALYVYVTSIQPANDEECYVIGHVFKKIISISFRP